MEATAFGALTIINRFEEYGVKISQIVNCGGIAEKSPLTMQIYADVTGRPMKLSRSAQTCVYKPNPKAHAIYRQLYALYKELHDAFGTKDWNGNLYGVMKQLIDIRNRVRK